MEAYGAPNLFGALIEYNLSSSSNDIGCFAKISYQLC